MTELEEIVFNNDEWRITKRAFKGYSPFYELRQVYTFFGGFFPKVKFTSSTFATSEDYELLQRIIERRKNWERDFHNKKP